MPSGEQFGVNHHPSLDLVATVSRSSDGAIVIDHLHVTAHDPAHSPGLKTESAWDIESTVRGLALQDGERTVILEMTAPANSSVAIAVTATALDEPAGQRAAGLAAAATGTASPRARRPRRAP